GEHTLKQIFTRSDLLAGAVFAGDEWRRETIFQLHEQLDGFLEFDVAGKVVINRDYRAGICDRVNFPKAVFLVVGQFSFITSLSEHTFDPRHQISILERSAQRRAIFAQHAFLSTKSDEQSFEQM